MGFRETILKIIEEQVCKMVLNDDSDIAFQNDIPGYENLYALQPIGPNKEFQIDPSIMLPIIRNSQNRLVTNSGGLLSKEKIENSYKAPRIQNSSFTSFIRRLYCRPIKNFDVTGLRPQSGRFSKERIDPEDFDRQISNSPSAFLHIVTGEKDIYWPQRNNPAKSRLDDQVEYLKIAIDCVLKNEAEIDKAGGITGNGECWQKLTDRCLPVPELPEIDLQNPLSGKYRPEYHKTINQQATQFIEDVESLLVLGPFRNRTYRYGPNHEKEARVMNTNLAIWGMLPEASNSPTDTVRAVFELEIHYPKQG